jgi:hypothetical protein
MRLAAAVVAANFEDVVVVSLDYRLLLLRTEQPVGYEKSK